MLKEIGTQSGLHIGGEPIEDIGQLQSDLTGLIKKEERHLLQSDLTGEILTATLASSQPVAFDDLQHFWENILFRLGAISAMTSLTAGVFDGDYYDPTLGPEPRLGTSGATRVSQYWQFLDPGKNEAAWQQTDGFKPAEVVKPVDGHSLPFRGECAGAFQLTVFWGLLDGLGSRTFTKLAAQFGSMLVGPWTDNPATDFMAQNGSLQDPPIPGDYMYFKNKDDYLKWAPNGFWQGLNAMYMGKDSLGTRHYSGMGASWLSEQNLRSSLVNAYYHDCYPHIVACPNEEVRFTIRRLLQVPSSFKQAVTIPQKGTTQPSGSAPTVATLQANGYRSLAASVFENPRTTLEECATLFGFALGDVHQHIGSGLENPPSRVRVPGATIIIDYHDPKDSRHDPKSIVEVTITLEKNR
ncbi:hypothetical protein [uncultured Roseibium sp.]|uniref:hypothetical protein n=1 Tax=uncultured Roseibium sp. TaxID=1936171 RepID=UPI0026044051|nr:hypothetical protein [uncultured Roseibium sp.]